MPEEQIGKRLEATPRTPTTKADRGAWLQMVAGCNGEATGNAGAWRDPDQDHRKTVLGACVGMQS